MLATSECLNMISYLNEVCGVNVNKNSLEEISKNLRFAGDNYKSNREFKDVVEECKSLLPFASSTVLCNLSFAPAIVCATTAPVVFAMTQHILTKKYLKNLNIYYLLSNNLLNYLRYLFAPLFLLT